MFGIRWKAWAIGFGTVIGLLCLVVAIMFLIALAPGAFLVALSIFAFVFFMVAFAKLANDEIDDKERKE